MLSLFPIGLNCDHLYCVVKRHFGESLKVEDGVTSPHASWPFRWNLSPIEAFTSNVWRHRQHLLELGLTPKLVGVHRTRIVRNVPIHSVLLVMADESIAGEINLPKVLIVRRGCSQLWRALKIHCMLKRDGTCGWLSLVTGLRPGTSSSSPCRCRRVCPGRPCFGRRWGGLRLGGWYRRLVNIFVLKATLVTSRAVPFFPAFTGFVDLLQGLVAFRRQRPLLVKKRAIVAALACSFEEIMSNSFRAW